MTQQLLLTTFAKCNSLPAAQNQLFTLQSDRESAAAGREEEADLAAAEVDAAQRRLAGLEAEKANLLAQVRKVALGLRSLRTPRSGNTFCRSGRRAAAAGMPGS